MAEQLGNDFETTLTAAITTAGQTTVTVADSAPSFHLPFADLGAGVVDLTESIGGITPTFTRASTATTTDFAGTVVGVASGEPRSYYDPTTLQYQGYLSEAARTNLCLQSEDLSTTWSVSGANSSVSTDAAVAPDGATAADKLVEDSTAAAQHFIVQSFTKAASATAYAVSIWAKAAGRNFCGLRLDDGAGNGARCDFTLTGGGTASSVVPLGTPFTALSATITAYPNGWYRCTLLATSNTATALRIVLNLESAAGTISYDGDGSSGVYFWGGQLEAASFGSSYIPTTTGSVTRNADALTYPATGGWFDASVGTMYVECTPLMLADSTQYSMVFHPAATSIHRIALLVNFIPQTNFLVLVSSVTQASINTGGYTPRQVMRVAGAYAANDFAAVKDGGTVGTDNAGSIPTIDTLSVGSFLGGAQLFGAIRHAYYFPVRLTDAEIQSITAAGNVGPPEANFRIRIDDELILVTSYLGPTLTMTRGIENTLATTHANAAPVFHVLTKGGLDLYLAERLKSGQILRRTIAVGDTLVVPDGHQLIVGGGYTIDGTLTLEGDAELVVVS